MLKIDIENNVISVWYWCDIILANYHDFLVIFIFFLIKEELQYLFNILKVFLNIYLALK